MCLSPYETDCKHNIHQRIKSKNYVFINIEQVLMFDSYQIYETGIRQTDEVVVREATEVK